MKYIFTILILLLTSNYVIAETCIASLYWPYSKGQRNTVTASGIPLRNDALTTAHKSLPLLSYATVTSLQTGKSVVVRVTDRGPFKRGRCVDLSLAAGAAIGMDRRQGLMRVSVKARKAADYDGFKWIKRTLVVPYVEDMQFLREYFAPDLDTIDNRYPTEIQMVNPSLALRPPYLEPYYLIQYNLLSHVRF